MQQKTHRKGGLLVCGSNRFNTRLNPRFFNDRRAAGVVHPSSVTKGREKTKPKYISESVNTEPPSAADLDGIGGGAKSLCCGDCEP